MTRKMLTMAGAFHRASDVDRLCVRSIEDLFEIRMLGLAKHFEEIAKKTQFTEVGGYA